MKENFVFISVFLVVWCLLFTSASLPGASEKMQDVKAMDLSVKPQDNRAAGTVRPDLNFGKFQLYFITNKGQVNEKAVFYAKASRYTLWLTKQGLVFDSFKKVEAEKKHPAPQGHSPQEGSNRFPHSPYSPYSTHSPKLVRDVSRLIFLNANTNPGMIPLEKTRLKVNYFIGNDKSKWNGDIPTSQAVLYKNLYKNIDLKVYGIEKQIEYDWIVKPGGNPGDIRFAYKNVKGTLIDHQGNLLIETDFGVLVHKRPVGCQNRKAQSEGVGAGLRACPQERKEVNVTFKKIVENIYGFEVGEYDKTGELVIDPVVLAYSTYLGGNSVDYSWGIAVDGSGYVYVTGGTMSTDFPCLNHYQTDPGDANWDAFVTKIDTSQSGSNSLIYSTYLGGGDSERCESIAVDDYGNAYVTGMTTSWNYPTLNQYQSDQGIGDGFVTKLDTTQSGVSSLIYSTYLGGWIEEYAHEIAVDNSGCAYVTGHTWSWNFPTRNGYQSGVRGNRDAFLSKIDTTKSGNSSLIYSTTLGGYSWDEGQGIAVDNNGIVYLTGYTGSSNFPVLNQYQTFQGGLCDALVAKIDTTQVGTSSLLYSTFLGGSDKDYGMSITLDNSGNVYVTGEVWSADFPTLNQYQAFQGGGSDVFVSKIDTSQVGASALLYSTYLGGDGDERGSGIALDYSGYAYVSGWTASTNFPTLNQYQADQPGHDVFVAKLDTTQSGASCLIYSTYLGGGMDDLGSCIAVDSSGCAYVPGSTLSADFPTRNQYQADQPDWDAFVVKIEPSYLSPSAIDDYIRDLPGTCFKNNAKQRKNALHNKLMEVQSLIDAGYYQEAIDKLTHDIRAKMDGIGKNDWIICSYAQEKLTAMIDSLIEYLEGLLLKT